MYEVTRVQSREGREVRPAVRQVDPVEALAHALLRARRAAIELAAWLVAPAEGEASPVHGRVRAEFVLQALLALETLAYAFAEDLERGPGALMAAARARAAELEVVA